MKRHILKYVGGSLDGRTLDTHSSDEGERMRAQQVLDMTSRGQVGQGTWEATEATMAGQVHSGTAEMYYVTQRQEDDVVRIRLTYRKTTQGKK